MSEHPHSVLVDRPQEVDVVRIEQELTQLWQRAAATGDGEQSLLLVRACSMNLIVVTNDAAELDALGEIVGELTIEHPSRSFLISANASASTAFLDAWISVRCALPASGGGPGETENKQVCCEQVTLKATGTDTLKVPSVILSLLVPDVPTVLVWKGEVDLRDGMVQSLVKICDRALIDSSEDPSPEERLRKWGKFVSNTAYRAAFGDLAWRHISPWRNLLADTFNPVHLRQHLSSIDTLNIRYSARPFPPHSGLSQALLFAGWIAQALHWTRVRPLLRSTGGGYDGVVQSDSRPVQIHVDPLDDGVPRLGEIEGVTVRSGDGLDLSLRSTQSRHCVRQSLRIGTGSTSERLLSVRQQTETELLSGELETLHADELYQSSMTSLLGLLEGQT